MVSAAQHFWVCPACTAHQCFCCGSTESLLSLLTGSLSFAVVALVFVQIMSNSGTALLGIGRGAGPDRAEEAILDAINTPLLQGHAIQVRLHGALRMPAAVVLQDEVHKR